jgi:glycosyltransferase involved in cell wall biosynthesis
MASPGSGLGLSGRGNASTYSEGKIVSSLAAGVPCVGTSIAVEGMRLNDGVDIAVCDTPETFAARVCEVHEDADDWARLSGGGHRKARLDFTIEADKERVASLFCALGLPTPMLANIHANSRVIRGNPKSHEHQGSLNSILIDDET